METYGEFIQRIKSSITLENGYMKMPTNYPKRLPKKAAVRYYTQKLKKYWEVKKCAK